MHCIFWGASVDFLFYTSPQGFTFLSVCFVSFSISLLFAKALVFKFHALVECSLHESALEELSCRSPITQKCI